ncbi:uncharacterized protein LOC131434849 isoform X2 [Malaya genurostris]|uniref:uncharacterized protein LOC131434849 isoform X2 n=1 Tax=Malaya genurostris TaxID=325434 RepID=UPI0026F3EFEB|nr:uncharacterized protein LOC131434849 isoform X2 [Malaya genurostris]
MFHGNSKHLAALLTAVIPLAAAMVDVESPDDSEARFCQTVAAQADVKSIIGELTSGIVRCFGENPDTDNGQSHQEPGEYLRSCSSFRSSLLCCSEFILRLDGCTPPNPIVRIMSTALSVAKPAFCAHPAAKSLRKLSNFRCNDKPTTIIGRCLEKLSKIKTITTTRFTFAELIFARQGTVSIGTRSNATFQ